MKNKSKSKKTENMFGGGVKWYREKIIELVKNIENAWILDQILQCIINITK